MHSNCRRGDDVLPTLALNYRTGEIVPHPDPCVGMTAEMMRELARYGRRGLTANRHGDPNLLPTGYSLDALCANSSPALRKPDSSNADVTAEAGAIDAGGWPDSEAALARGRGKGHTTSRAGGVEEDEADHQPDMAHDVGGYDQLTSGMGPPGEQFDGRGTDEVSGQEEDDLGGEEHDQADMPLAPVSATLEEIIGGRQRPRSGVQRDLRGAQTTRGD
jgi:hypothetical protein